MGASDDVWAVGDHGTLIHWNGREWAWSRHLDAIAFDAVWGSGAGDVWVVGEGDTILHRGRGD